MPKAQFRPQESTDENILAVFLRRLAAWESQAQDPVLKVRLNVFSLIMGEANQKQAGVALNSGDLRTDREREVKTKEGGGSKREGAHFELCRYR